MMLKNLITTILCLSLTAVFSQKVENQIIEKFNEYKYYNSFEYSFIKTDKRIYYSGTSINFSAVVFDQYFLTTTLSKICYLELIHEDGEFHERYVYRLDSGIVNAHINIPIDIPTGNYQLVAYTNYMRNFPMEDAMHRIPIYIQNTLDEPQQVVSQITGGSNTILSDSSSSSMKINETPSSILVEIPKPNESGKQHFLASEAFGTLQFVAKVNFNGNQSRISIPKDRLRGAFQKIILVDENLEVISSRSFFVKDNSSQIIANNPSALPRVGDNVLTAYTSDNESIRQDSIDLFRRIYRLFYKIPQEISIENLSYDQLIDNNSLLKYSKYSIAEWHDIMAGLRSNESVSFLPEKNIQLKGKVEGDLITNDKASLTFHFFNNDMDISYALDESGAFSIDLILPVGKDFLYCTVLDKYRNDITNKFTISLETMPLQSYHSNVAYMPQASTNAIISSELNFRYILSTYSNLTIQDDFFWEKERFDQKIKVEDYVGLESFEDFVREAVMNVSVVSENGVKALNIYNSNKGAFEKPQMLILNNQVLNSAAPLFDIPIDSIKSISTVINQKTLYDFGASFRRGIIVVLTDPEYKPGSLEIPNNFIPINGYYLYPVENEISKRFETPNSTMVSQGQAEYKIESEGPDTTKTNVTIQSLRKDGSFELYTQQQ